MERLVLHRLLITSQGLSRDCFRPKSNLLTVEIFTQSLLISKAAYSHGVEEEPLITKGNVGMVVTRILKHQHRST